MEDNLKLCQMEDNLNKYNATKSGCGTTPGDLVLIRKCSKSYIYGQCYTLHKVDLNVIFPHLS